MNNGWIKLHRKLLDNDDLFRGGSTFPVWCYLLLKADRSGVVKIGRFEMSRVLKIKPSTIYLALKRLENLTMIQQQPDSNRTVIYICNWNTYQQQPDSKLNETRQIHDTIQEGRSKNKKINTGIVFENKELETAFNDFEQMRNRIKKPMTEKAKQLIISKLEKLYPKQSNMQIECLNQSIENCWQSLYAVKQTINPVRPQPSNRPDTTLSDEDRAKGRKKLEEIRKELIEKSII